mgnify:CR=1 FL=1
MCCVPHAAAHRSSQHCYSFHPCLPPPRSLFPRLLHRLESVPNATTARRNVCPLGARHHLSLPRLLAAAVAPPGTHNLQAASHADATAAGCSWLHWRAAMLVSAPAASALEATSWPGLHCLWPCLWLCLHCGRMYRTPRPHPTDGWIGRFDEGCLAVAKVMTDQAPKPLHSATSPACG